MEDEEVRKEGRKERREEGEREVRSLERKVRVEGRRAEGR